MKKIIIHTYICKHFIKDEGELLKYNNFIYAKSFKEAKLIMMDLVEEIGLRDASIEGKLIEAINSDIKIEDSLLSSVDLTPYFIYFQLDKILKHSLLSKKKLEDVKNALIVNENYELVAIMHRKLESS
jgi:hypothetical protein